MIKYLSLLLLSISALSSAAQSTALDKEVETIARTYMARPHAIGMSIGVLRGDSTFFYGYGLTKKDSGNVPSARTLFEIGSITKTFTSTVLAMAVEQGKLKLDDPVNKFLPDSIPLLQYNNRAVTLRDLANHTSAIPRMPFNFQETVVDFRDPYKNYSVDHLYSFLKHLQLTREPGSHYDYSNVAVGLLGVILQHLYHSSYEELVLSSICQPLGMQDTRVSLRKEDSAYFAMGYDAGGEYNGPWNLPAAFAAAGAIRSNAGDMLKYARASMSAAPGELSAAMQLTHDSTFSQGQLILGLGWHIIRLDGEKILFHNGGTGGYGAYLGIHAARRLAVVILVNAAVSADNQGNTLMRWLMKQ